jgi:adenosylcobinamide-phosphate synthase
VDRFAPLWGFLLLGPFLLKVTFAWRALEEHARAVEEAVQGDLGDGRRAAGRMVSRDTAPLSREETLSAAYESVSENLVDSIAAPLLFYAAFSFAGLGLAAAAFYRAANTMDAMLGYRDHRARIGWFPARMDDLLTWIPARVTGGILLAYFAVKGRLRTALDALRTDARKRPGPNGGIPMAIMAGGTGVRFVKPGAYTMGTGEKSLAEGGREIIAAVRAVTLTLAAILVTALVLWA